MIKSIFNSVSVLNKKFQKKFLIILILVITGSLIETLSLYLIYQTIKYFSDPIYYMSNENLFLDFYEYLNFADTDLIFFILIFLCN